MIIIRHITSMATLLDHKTTLAYLAYLGYPQQPQTSALSVTKPRKHDRKRGKVTRNVFLCYVCGAAGSGKTTLLRSFVGKPYRDEYEPTTKPISVVNSVDINGSEKYLVVGEFVIGIQTRRTMTSVNYFHGTLCSCRNLGQDTKQRHSKIPKRQIWRM